jgi:subfamily B ATP-binding cassette protein MsbA
MSYYARLYRFVKPYVPRMVSAALLVMCVAGINLALLRLAGVLWDVITVQHDEAHMIWTIMVFLVLVVAQGVLSMAHGYVTAGVSQQIMADFRTHLFGHLQRLSLGFFVRRRTGEILSRLMNDVGVIQATLTETPIDSTKQLVTFLGGVGFLLAMNWRLCLVILLLLPVLVMVARLFGKRLKALSTDIQDQTASLTTLAEEVLSGIRVVKSFVQTRREERRFAQQTQAALRLALRRAAVLAIFIPTITLLTFAATAVVLWYGGRQVIQGVVSPGDLFAFVLFAGILIGPFGSAARIFSQLKEAQGAMARVFEILDTKPEIQDSPDAVDLPVIIGQVEVRHVTFAYDGQHPVLSDVSFEVKPGDLVAIVGPTGAGKTTLVNLLHRFYDPSDGEVRLDGYDLRTLRMENLYRQIGLVPQETVLFGGTIMDNIRYGREDASDGEVIEASQAANADEFVARLPEGYCTIVGEKGMNLSGGQRQRLAIARAVLKRPKLLLLDEATSALDAESERLVQEAIDRLMAGRTTFVVAHRLTTVQRATRILVLNRGRIVEEGDHATLMERRGLYHYLYTLRQL